MIYIIGLFFIGVFILILSKKIEKKLGLKKARFQFGIEPICFVESPMFAELLAGGGYIGTYLCYGAALVAVVIEIAALVTVPIKTADSLNEYLAIAGIFVVAISGSVACKLIAYYNDQKYEVFFEEYVAVGQFGKGSRIVTYKELGESVRQKGIFIHKGNIVLPFEGGSVRIEIHDTLDKNDIISFVNTKCNLQIPYFNKNEKKNIRRTSILPVFLTISVSMWLMDLAFMMIGAIIEWGERSFMEIYFQSNLIEFCRIHFLITMTVPLIISGILMGVISKIGIRKVLGKYNMFKF